MASSDFTSRVIAQTTEDTGRMPAGVSVASLTAETLREGSEPLPLADAPHPVAANAPQTATATSIFLCSFIPSVRRWRFEVDDDAPSART